MYTIVHIRAFSFYFLFLKKKKKIAISDYSTKGFSVLWIGLFCIANFYFLLNLKAELFSKKKERNEIEHFIDFYRKIKIRNNNPNAPHEYNCTIQKKIFKR